MTTVWMLWDTYRFALVSPLKPYVREAAAKAAAEARNQRRRWPGNVVAAAYEPRDTHQRALLVNAAKSAAAFFQEVMPHLNVADSALDADMFQCWNEAEIAARAAVTSLEADSDTHVTIDPAGPSEAAQIAELKAALQAQTDLVDRLCEAADAEAEDRPSEGSLKLLRLLGPGIARNRALAKEGQA